MHHDPLIRIPDDVELDADILADYLAKYDTIAKNDVFANIYRPPDLDVTAGHFAELGDAYANRYPIYRMPAKPKWKPDVRLSINKARSMTDQFEGFFMGRGVTVTSSDKELQSMIDRVNAHIRADDLNATISKLVSIYGRAYRIAYVGPDKKIGSANLDPVNAFAIYDESITPKMRYFVRFYRSVSGEIRGSVSDDTYVRYFRFNVTGKDLHDKSRNKSARGPMLEFYDEAEHGFDRVPCVEFYADDSRHGLYEDSLAAINEYNKALCEKANEADASSNSYLVVTGAEVGDDESRFIRENRLINLTVTKSEGGAEFIGRPNCDGLQENLLNRLNEEIYNVSMVVDTSSDKFVYSSGTAMRWKMLPMFNRFADKWRKFHDCLMDFYKLVFSNKLVELGGGIPDAADESGRFAEALEDLVIENEPNYPDIDLLSVAGQAGGEIAADETPDDILPADGEETFH